MQPDQLSLYMFHSCPYCQRVLGAIDDLGLGIELRDVRADPERRRELVEATGRGTVPCLRIEEPGGQVRWMHESLDIVAFLREQFGRASA